MNYSHPTRRHVDDDLKAYVDGELGLVRRLQVARHLASCDECREKEQEMKRITEQLHGFGAKKPALSPDLRAQLLATAPAGRGGDAPSAVPLWRRSPGLVFGGGGLSLAASLAAFAFLYSTANQTPGGFDDQSGREVTLAAPAVGAASGPQGVSAERAVALPKTASDQPAAGMARRAGGGGRGAVSGAFEPEAMEKTAASAGAGGGFGGGAPTSAPVAGMPIPSMAARSPRPAQMLAQNNRIRPVPSQSAQYTPDALLDTRQVHREASLGVAVPNPEAASAQVETLVTEWGGYVASNVLTTDASGYKAADLTLKVPEEHFDDALRSIGKLGDVRSKNITGEDITEQMSDATSDEQVLMDEAEKLDKRLKTESMSERRTAQTEMQARQVRQELARTRARLGLLRKMARLSTLNVSLTEKAKVDASTAVTTPKTGFWADMKDSNRSALKAFQAAVRVPLLLVIWAVALSPLWLPLLLAYRHLSRKQQIAHEAALAAERQAATPPEPSSLDR